MDPKYFHGLKVGERTYRFLSLPGLNLVREALQLPRIRPDDWLAMGSDERKMLRHDTLARATPELAERLFGERIDWRTA
jgi:hypothetical protein